MKILQVVAAVAGVALVGVGVAMASTNPSRSAYEEYALGRLTDYLKDQGCEKVPIPKKQCVSLVKSATPQIKQIIAKSTDEQNFLLFSLYKTEFSLPLLPSYEFETLGAFQSFYIYKGQKQ